MALQSIHPLVSLFCAVVVLSGGCRSNEGDAQCAQWTERLRSVSLPVELQPWTCRPEGAQGTSTASRGELEAAFRAAGYRIMQPRDSTYGDTSERFSAVPANGGEAIGVRTGPPQPRGRSITVALTVHGPDTAMIPAEQVETFSEERMLADRQVDYERAVLARRLFQDARSAPARCRDLPEGSTGNTILLEVPEQLSRPVLDPPLAARTLDELATAHASPGPERNAVFAAYSWERGSESRLTSGSETIVTTQVGAITVGVIDPRSESLLCALVVDASEVIRPGSFREEEIRAAAEQLRSRLLTGSARGR